MKLKLELKNGIDISMSTVLFVFLLYRQLMLT